jgi:hypothetical protein
MDLVIHVVVPNVSKDLSASIFTEWETADYLLTYSMVQDIN